MYHDNANTDGTCNEKVVYKESTELLGGQVENQARFNYGTLDVTYGGYMTGDTKLIPISLISHAPLLLLMNEIDYDNPTINYSKSYHYKDGTYYLDGEILQGKLADLCNKKNCKLKGYYIIAHANYFGQTEGVTLGYVELYDKIKITRYNDFSITDDSYVSDAYKYENGKFILSGNIMTVSEAKTSGFCKTKTCYTLDKTDQNEKNSLIYKIIDFSESSNSVNVEYLTYGTDTKKEILSNKNDSQMKKMLDAWYEININNKNLATKIADEIYCNDRSQMDIDENKYIKDYVEKNKQNISEFYENIKDNMKLYGYENIDKFLEDFAKTKYSLEIEMYNDASDNYNNIYSGFYTGYRFGTETNFHKENGNFIKNSDNITYKCKNKTDRFTTSTLGNGKLKYPIATITADEVMYAGASPKGSNKNYFLANNGSFWTMTPLEYNADVGWGMYVVAVRDDGMIESLLVDDASVDMGDGFVRRGKPVISLKSDIETTKGNGTVSNPYVIK